MLKCRQVNLCFFALMGKCMKIKGNQKNYVSGLGAARFSDTLSYPKFGRNLRVFKNELFFVFFKLSQKVRMDLALNLKIF